jgi:kinesin family protein 11
LLIVERKTSVFISNTKAVSTHTKSITADVTSLSTKLEEFIKSSNSTTTKLRADAKQFQTKELEILAGQSGRIDSQLHRVQDALNIIRSKDAASNEAISVIQDAVYDVQNSFKTGFATWSEALKKRYDAVCQELQATVVNELGTVSSGIHSRCGSNPDSPTGGKSAQSHGFTC